MIKTITTAVMLLVGVSAFSQCNDLYNEYVHYKAAYSVDSDNSHTHAGVKARRDAYRNCIVKHNGGEGLPYRLLTLEQKIVRQRKNTNAAIILMFTPAMPIGGIMSIVARVRQNHLNYALYQEAIK